GGGIDRARAAPARWGTAAPRLPRRQQSAAAAPPRSHRPGRARALGHRGVRLVAPHGCRPGGVFTRWRADKDESGGDAAARGDTADPRGAQPRVRRYPVVRAPNPTGPPPSGGAALPSSDPKRPRADPAL